MSTPSAGLPSVRGFSVPLGGQLTDLGYAAGWRVVRAMPEFAARNAFEAGALYASRGGGPEQLRKNLARVIGVPPAEVPGSLIRASLASYARYWREAFRLPSMDHQVLARRLNESPRRAASTSPPHWTPAAVPCWRFRTAATGTWPGCG